MSWERAAALEELERGPAVFKKSPRQIALFRVGTEVYAVDNRCPHEGYPLVEGMVDDNCVLTCNWHNWQFRLEDGQCVLGGDHVRTYAVRQADGHAWVKLEDPPPDVIERNILSGLKTSFVERDFGRMCREISRLYYNRLDPLLAIHKSIAWSHDKFEFGTTHAYAAAADWLSDYRTYVGDWQKQLICLAEAADHMAFDALRHASYPFPDAGEPFEGNAFAEAVEGQQRERAEAMVRRGLDDGLEWQDMESAFAEAALAHYNDFWTLADLCG